MFALLPYHTKIIDTFSFKGVKVSMLGFSTVDQGSAVGSYKDYNLISQQ
jgi:hypothetical protein